MHCTRIKIGLLNRTVLCIREWPSVGAAVVQLQADTLLFNTFYALIILLLPGIQ